MSRQARANQLYPTTLPPILTLPVMKPGQERNEKSFLSIKNPEALVAAYCNFKDIGRFRRFLMSPFVLPHYINYLPYKMADHKLTLGLLVSALSKRSPPDNEPLGIHEQGLKSQDEYGKVLVASQMLRALKAKQKATLAGMSTASTIVIAADIWFKEATGYDVPATKVPFSAEEIPDFGPLNGETEIEPLNRCLCLLAHMETITSSTMWRARYGSTNWDRPMYIVENWVPRWMLGAEIVARDARRRNVKVDRGYSEPIQSTGPEGNEGFTKIPQIASVTLEYGMVAEQARDRIRRAFGLDKVPAQISQLYLIVQGDEQHPWIYSAISTRWNSLRDIIWSHDDQDPRVSFRMELVRRDPDKGLWEYDWARYLQEIEQGDENVTTSH